MPEPSHRWFPSCWTRTFAGFEDTEELDDAAHKAFQGLEVLVLSEWLRIVLKQFVDGRSEEPEARLVLPVAPASSCLRARTNVISTRVVPGSACLS